MNSWKLLAALFLLSVLLGDVRGLPRMEWMAQKSRLRQTPDWTLEAQRRSADKRSGQLLCYGCRNTDPGSNSCTGTVETCQGGELCASVFHSDNTNLDGCLAATICYQLEKSVGIYARCCSDDFCNM